jgi:hypothetical protein
MREARLGESEGKRDCLGCIDVDGMTILKLTANKSDGLCTGFVLHRTPTGGSQALVNRIINICVS